MSELLNGIEKIENVGYSIYFIKCLSDELKTEIRNRLVSICHGVNRVDPTDLIYSYRSTVKEFLCRYRADDVEGEAENNKAMNRKKGMIGELLIHVLLDIENRFIPASPFFNMEERSFKKGYDVALFDAKDNELWIAEVKSGHKKTIQANSSSAIVGLINEAKNDLESRLNEHNRQLWLNALNSAKVTMDESTNQKDALIKLLLKSANEAEEKKDSSKDYNAVLCGCLFHTQSEPIEEKKIKSKYDKIARERVFKGMIVIALQKSTYQAVCDFLKSEVEEENEE